MHTLKAVIESTEKNYSAYIENLDGVVATGRTIAEIKENLISAVADLAESCKALKCELPDELNDGDIIIELRTTEGSELLSVSL